MRNSANQKGVIPPILLIFLAAIGIIIFFLLTSLAPFKDRLFATLFPKPPSHAQETTDFISNLITDPNAVFSVPNVSKPAYLTPFTDPTFHTTITRIGGDAGTSFTALNGTGTWGTDVRQHYNDDQAWNADQSLIALENRGTGASPNFVVLDGETYQPKYIKCSNYDFYDHRWHPSLNHKNERIAVKGTTLQWFDVVNCQQTRVWSLPFASQGDLSQNPSSDGRYTTLWDYSSQKIFVVDMDPQAPFHSYDGTDAGRRIGPVFDLKTNCGRSTCPTAAHASISPSGKYVLIGYEGDYKRVLDVDPDTLALTPHAEPANASECPDQSTTGGMPDPALGWVWDLGHEGISYNSFDNNEEVIIGQRRSWCKTLNGVTLGHVVMVRLRDGQVTSLTDPNNEASNHHISTVNTNRPGWAYVSYYPGSNTRFAGEVIAVKMDGSKAVQRFLHHHSDVTNCYRCEVHPVPSRDGFRVIFASGWSLNCGSSCGSQSNPQAYVMDARAAAEVQPAGQTSGWSLIFNDEFNGTSVDLTKWRPNWLGSSDTAITKPINSAETGCYDPKQATVGSGELDLTAIASSCSVNGITYNYRSGMVESNGKFNFTYGYMEARIWTPAGTGVWPAFWSDGQNWPYDGEIDVLEAYGTDESSYHYHYAGCGGDCNPGGSITVPGATSGWHTYAADWEQGIITWYYDGKQVWQYTTSITQSPQYLILNLGLKSNQSQVPATMRVDYVRVWKRNTTPIPTPTTVPTPTPISDTIAPTVTISSPVNGSTATGLVRISAVATDNVKVSSMQVYIDGKLKASSNTGSINTNWNTRQASSGTHTIQVKASDPSNNIGSSNITVNK